MDDLKALMAKWDAKGVDTSVYMEETSDKDIHLSQFIVAKEYRGEGLGTAFMEELIAYADKIGKRISLSPEKGYSTTSVNRLREFYKRFGFVRNRGRHMNYRLSSAMYRNPKTSVKEDVDGVSGLTKEMIDWFEERTNRHIKLVQKYAKKLADVDERFQDLPVQTELHDANKFEDPDHDPYVFVVWSYKCKKDGKPCEIPPGMQDKMNQATEHHVKTNSHHPEYHTNQENVINREDRDKPPEKMIDATKMPDIDVAEMVCDWCAMSEELGGSPFDWSGKNVNVRWGFTPGQTLLIKDLLLKVWGDSLDNGVKEAVDELLDTDTIYTKNPEDSVFVLESPNSHWGIGQVGFNIDTQGNVYVGNNIGHESHRQIPGEYSGILSFGKWEKGGVTIWAYPAMEKALSNEFYRSKIIRGLKRLVGVTIHAEHEYGSGGSFISEITRDAKVKSNAKRNTIFTLGGMGGTNESIIDPTRDELDPAIFDDGGVKEKVLKQVINDVSPIFDKYGKPDEFFIKGSLLTYEWKEDTDLDVYIVITGLSDEDKDEAQELAKTEINDLPVTIEGTDHPLEVYVDNEPYSKDNADSIYDILTGKWVKGPMSVHADPALYMAEFHRMVDNIDLDVAELIRDIIDYDVLRSANIPKLEGEIESKIAEIDTDVDKLVAEYDKAKEKRHAAFKREYSLEELRDIKSKNLLPDNICFKLAGRYLYLELLKGLKDLTVGGEQPIEEPKDVEKVKKVIKQTHDKQFSVDSEDEIEQAVESILNKE